MYVDFGIPYSSLAVVNKMSHDDCKFPEATLVKTVNHLTQKFGGDDVTCCLRLSVSDEVYDSEWLDEKGAPVYPLGGVAVNMRDIEAGDVTGCLRPAFPAISDGS